MFRFIAAIFLLLAFNTSHLAAASGASAVKIDDNHFCDGRGSKGGSGKYSTRVQANNPQACINWVSTNTDCSQIFSYGQEDGYCDCVPSTPTGGTCKSTPVNGYQTYVLLSAPQAEKAEIVPSTSTKPTLTDANFQPFTETFGGNGGNYHGLKKIQSIAIRSGRQVDALIINGHRYGGGGGSQTTTLTLGAGEYISSMTIRHERLIDYLKITTNKGRSIEGGGTGGTRRTINGVITDIGVGHGRLVDRLVIQRKRIPMPVYQEHNTTWETCAIEGARCKISGERVVRYGANGHYYYFKKNADFTCSHVDFGHPVDPKYRRSCQVSASNLKTVPADNPTTFSFWTKNGTRRIPEPLPSKLTVLGRNEYYNLFEDSSSLWKQSHPSPSPECVSNPLYPVYNARLNRCFQVPSLAATCNVTAVPQIKECLKISTPHAASNEACTGIIQKPKHKGPLGEMGDSLEVYVGGC